MSKNKDKKSLYDFTPENDIKYKGVISYRHLKIMGWFCLAMTVINIFLGAGIGSGAAAVSSAGAGVITASNKSGRCDCQSSNQSQGLLKLVHCKFPPSFCCEEIMLHSQL